MTPEQVASAVGWSRPKQVALETGKQRPKVAEVEALLALYGSDEATALALIKLVQTIHLRGWWLPYRDVLPPSLPELESNSLDIRTWQQSVVPGLLQTDYYALALIKMAHPEDTGDSHARKLAARAVRRTLLTREGAPSLYAVVDEAVLRRPTGGREVMREQYETLLQAAKRPNVHLQVMATETWEHPGAEGSFTWLGYGGAGDLDVVYMEGAVGTAVYLEALEQVRATRVTHDRIREAALSEEDSQAFIADLITA